MILVKAKHEEIDLLSGHALKTKSPETVYQIASLSLPRSRLIEDSESIYKVEIGPCTKLKFQVINVPLKLQLTLEYEECMSISDRGQL